MRRDEIREVMGTHCTGPYKTLCFLLGVILIAWEDFEQKICFKTKKQKPERLCLSGCYVSN